MQNISYLRFFRHISCLSRISYVFLFCALFGLPNATFAQRTDTTEVVISATRTAIPAAYAPFYVEAIGRDMFQGIGQRSLADVLARHGHVFIKQYGSSGLASISLRGTNASQTAILLDGFRLSDPQLGQLDMSLLPMNMVQNVEVLHGAASALYGSSAMGGAVQLNTVPHATFSAKPVLNAELNYEKGAFALQNFGAQVSANTKRWGVQAAIHDRSTQNDFPYTDQGKSLKRENADRHDTAKWVSLFAKHKQHQIRANGWWNEAERGLVAPLGQAANGARQADKTQRFWLMDEWHRANLSLKVGGMFQKNRIGYQYPAWNYAEDGNTTSAQALAQAQWLLSEAVSLHGGAQFEQARAEHPSLAKSVIENGLGIHLNSVIHKGNLRLFPALRLDRRTDFVATERQDFKGVLSPTLGLNYALYETSSKRVHLKSSAGRVFRAPTLNDRFWQFGGNPDLLPESGWQTDFGMLWQNAAFQVEISGFATRLRNQIVWQPQPKMPDIWSPFNVQKTQTSGIEFSAHHSSKQAFGAFSHGISAQVISAQDKSNEASPSYNKQLIYVPKTQIKAFGQWQKSGDRNQFVALMSLRYVGTRFTTADESASLPAFFVGDISLRYEQKYRAFVGAAFLSIENALNADYAVIKSYPMPPRHLRMGISVRV